MERNAPVGLRDVMRRGMVELRDSFDGWRHPARRRLAVRRLRALQPNAILFVCLGNVCRSPYGAGVVAARTGGRIAVDSAGFLGPGRPPPDDAIAAARARGIDHSGHRSKLITPDLLRAADVYVVFDRFNVRQLGMTPGVQADRVFWLGDFDPRWSGKRAIIDPWGRGPAVFSATFERIERCVLELVHQLEEHTPS